jgi:hypothetical protein
MISRGFSLLFKLTVVLFFIQHALYSVSLVQNRAVYLNENDRPDLTPIRVATRSLKPKWPGSLVGQHFGAVNFQVKNEYFELTNNVVNPHGHNFTIQPEISVCSKKGYQPKTTEKNSNPEFCHNWR